MNEYQERYSDELTKRGWDPNAGGVNYWRSMPPDNLDERDEIMICRVCKLGLNRFTTPDGVDWVHSRTWERHDHEPEPVSIPRPAWHERDLICDFCGQKGLKWKYVGERMQHVRGNLGNDYGTSWGACGECAAFVDAGDIEGLGERIRAKSFVFRNAQSYAQDEMVRQIKELHGRFLPSIHTREYIGPPVKGSRLNPRLMPKIQDGLARYWRKPDLYDRLIKPDRGFSYSVPGIHVGWERPEGMERFVARWTDDVPPEFVFRKHTEHLAIGAEAASLYWISSSFTTLAATAGLDLKEVSIAREELPSPHGLIIWEDPVGEIQRPHGVAEVRAMSWTLVPEGVWVNVYIQGEDADPEIVDIAAFRAESGYLVCPNIGTGIPFVGLGGVDDDFRAHPGNFLLTLIATWALMDQPGVAEQTVAQPDKKQQRAARRSGRSIPEVRVVNLRKRPSRPHVDSEAHRELKYRKFVPGHWKRQFYGPKRGLRKRIYISPYVARPDLPAPPPKTPTVRVLR